jgi:hypothetical protein
MTREVEKNNAIEIFGSGTTRNQLPKQKKNSTDRLEQVIAEKTECDSVQL